MARRTVLLPGLRHRALLSVMLYSFARVSAVLGMIRLFWEAAWLTGQGDLVVRVARWQIDAEQATAVVPRAPGGDGTGDSGTVSPSTGARAGRRAA